MILLNLCLKDINKENLFLFFDNVFNSSLKNIFMIKIETNGKEISCFEVEKGYKKIYKNAYKVIINLDENYSEDDLYNICFNLIELNRPFLIKNPSEKFKKIAKDTGLFYSEPENIFTINLSKPSISVLYTIYEIFQDNMSMFKTYDKYSNILTARIKENDLIYQNKKISLNSCFENIMEFLLKNNNMYKVEENEYIFNDKISDFSFYEGENVLENRENVEKFKISVFNKIKSLTIDEWETLDTTLANYLARNEYLPLYILEKYNKEMT